MRDVLQQQAAKSFLPAVLSYPNRKPGDAHRVSPDNHKHPESTVVHAKTGRIDHSARMVKSDDEDSAQNQNENLGMNP